MKEPVTRLDDCQSLLVSQINSTLTHFADHCAQCSHDALNRSLCGERITPRLVWENCADKSFRPRVAPCCVMTRCSTSTPRAPSHWCGDSRVAIPKPSSRASGW
jgi:hypothetical protein